jgi:hypothetical protein
MQRGLIIVGWIIGTAISLLLGQVFGAQQMINLGTPNQGDGDPIYTAFGKVQANFTELFSGSVGLTATNTWEAQLQLKSHATPDPVTDVGQIWYSDPELKLKFQDEDGSIFALSGLYPEYAATPQFPVYYVDPQWGSTSEWGYNNPLRPYQSITYALYFAPTNSVIMLSPGVHLLDADQYTAVKSGQTIMGRGPSTIIKIISKNAGANTAALWVPNATNVVLRDFVIDANGSAFTFGAGEKLNGIALSNSRNVTIQNVTIQNIDGYRPTYLTALECFPINIDSCTNVLVTGVTIEKVLTTFATGIIVGNSKGVRVMDSYIDCKSIGLGTALDVADITFENITVTNAAYGYNHDTYGTGAFVARDVTVRDCTFYGTAIGGGTGWGDSALHFVNNKWTNLVLVGNTFVRWTNGLSLGYTDSVEVNPSTFNATRIEGNFFENCSTNILLQSHTNTVANGNIFRGGVSLLSTGRGPAGGMTMMQGQAAATPMAGISTLWANQTNGLPYVTTPAGTTHLAATVMTNVIGAGTDYTLTGAYARVDFGTTDPDLNALPAGVWLIMAEVSFQGGATTGDDYNFRLYNATGAAAIAGSTTHVEVSLANGHSQASITVPITLTTDSRVYLEAYNATAVRGTVLSAGTRMTALRIQ